MAHNGSATFLASKPRNIQKYPTQLNRNNISTKTASPSSLCQTNQTTSTPIFNPFAQKGHIYNLFNLLFPLNSF